MGLELQWTAEVPFARTIRRQKSGSLRKVTWVWIGLTELPGESQMEMCNQQPETPDWSLERELRLETKP